jgi:RNA ligase (TIGR02306 family)
MRKLASIRQVIDIQPIEGADFIEVITVDGWKLVAKKGEFAINDYCMYFEIDSLLPISDERFAFLSTRSIKDVEGVNYHRLKSMKLKGQISQGLALPISQFKDEVGLANVLQLVSSSALPRNAQFNSDDFLEKDYSGVLNIIKYEPPVKISGNMRIVGSFPTHLVPKTDEERIQNLFNKYKQNGTFTKYNWRVSEKLDGTSFSCLLNEEDEFIVCSRNHIVTENSVVYQDHMLENDNVYTAVAKKYKLEEKLRDVKSKYNLNLAIQGEIIGPGIQGNSYKLNELKLFIFNTYLIDHQKKSSDIDSTISLINSMYHNFDNIEELMENFETLKIVNLQMVPDLDEEFNLIINKLNDNTITLEELLLAAEGKSTINKNTEREGIVFVGHNENNAKDIISFKVISNKFLLKEK